jgi:hypothetical protein
VAEVVSLRTGTSSRNHTKTVKEKYWQRFMTMYETIVPIYNQVD